VAWFRGVEGLSKFSDRDARGMRRGRKNTTENCANDMNQGIVRDDGGTRDATVRRKGVKTAALYDVDSRIPNLALMKLSAWHKARGWDVRLVRHSAEPIRADAHYAATIFHRPASRRRVAALGEALGHSLVVGGTGWNLRARLPAGAERMFPDYSLYGSSPYAVGFLTRGCVCRCPFCLVPRKEGRLRRCPGGFDSFVPPGQKHVVLLDNNLLAHPAAAGMLRETVRRGYAVNFSQSLDIAYLTEPLFEILRHVDSRNARFTRRQFYFSVNHASDIACFEAARPWLRSLGEDTVSVILLYGYNTRLSMENLLDYIEKSREEAERVGSSVKDFRVFDFSFIPDKPLIRPETKRIIDSLVCYQQTGIPRNLVIVGPRGCVKTLTFRCLSKARRQNFILLVILRST
jgi:hypothetical protein